MLDNITPLNEVNNNLRGFYKEFLDSEVGKDFIMRLLQLEASFQAEGFKSADFESKALAMEKIGLLYQIRTMLVDLSSPPRTQTPSANKKDLRRGRL